MPYIIIICSFKCGVWGYLIFLNFGKYKTLKFYLYIFFHNYHKNHKVFNYNHKKTFQNISTNYEETCSRGIKLYSREKNRG